MPGERDRGAAATRWRGRHGTGGVWRWWPWRGTIRLRPWRPCPPRNEPLRLPLVGDVVARWASRCRRRSSRRSPCAMNFTNEGGVDGTARFLKNITGMWLLEECRARVEPPGQGRTYAYAEIVAHGRGRRAGRRTRHRPRRRGVRRVRPTCRQAIRDWCRGRGKVPSPADDAALDAAASSRALAARYGEVLGNLRRRGALRHRAAARDRRRRAERPAEPAYGRRLSAIPVVAGPAGARRRMGNVMVQARAAGAWWGRSPRCGATSAARWRSRAVSAANEMNLNCQSL